MGSKIVIAGKQSEIPSLATLILSQNQILRDKDIGRIVATPEDYYIQRNPIGLKVIIFSRSYDKTTQKETVAKIGIPWVDRAKITWKNIKKVTGDQYTTGKKYAHYRIRHESGISQMKVWANTESTAEQILKRAAALSEGVLLGGRQGKIILPKFDTETTEYKKEEVVVKPYYFTIVNQRQKLVELRKGTVSKTTEKEKFWLHYDTPPKDYDRKIQEALKLGDND